jgi:hypothetical protein
MLEFYEPGAAIIEDTVATAVARVTKANRSAVEFNVRREKVTARGNRVRQ